MENLPENGGCIPNFIAIVEKSSTGFWDTLQSHMGRYGARWS